MAEKPDGSLSKDMANWMANLPEKLQNTPLMNLAIPGSHNSCSYSISPHSDIAPDNDFYGNLLLKALGPIGKHIMYSWSLTQSIPVKLQLEAGIRYFDLRIAVKNTDDKGLYIVHGLYGFTVDDFFVDVKEFLDNHNKEVLLLHFQHFFGLSDDDHQRLLHKLTSNFGAQMCQFTTKVENLALSALWRKGYQLIVFYEHESLAKYHPFLWPTSYIPNPWADKDDIKSLLTFWTEQYEKGHESEKFFVLQGVGTPQPATVMLHICSTLKSFVAPKVNIALADWLLGKTVGPKGCNVIMTDFIDMIDYKIPQMVVDMNNQLLQTLP